MKSIVLCEKPSVAREIARVLNCGQKQKSHFEGAHYVVTWALGHLVELAEPEDYDHKYKTWKLEDLPLLPGKMKLKPGKDYDHLYMSAVCRAEADWLIGLNVTRVDM